MTPSVIVHGGAGALPPARRADHAEGCLRAARAGVAVLGAGGSALDATQRAVEVLEDDPRFNAGRGACLTRDGEVELDAAIADGAGPRYGGVCALPPFAHPIAVARAVLEANGHVLYAAHGAREFALRHGFEALSSSALITEAALARWRAVQAGEAEAGWPGGTVGAVAFDGRHLAAATSTGGMMNKHPGRVGDSPIPGAGTVADDAAGAASLTGHGERILQLSLGAWIVAALERGDDPMAVAEAAIARLAARVDGTGGVVLLDRRGRPGWAHNTPSMSRAWVSLDGQEASGA
ncbi:MAG: isoaspartyl peptidase/L-asparaginase [Myxococcales bacterium]|nr:isoaspartyl peptidase/L-asparaginase [Myxococcales bacterium]